LLLGACTDDPAPKEPTGTASATASRPAPTATLPAMPDQAKEDTNSGAAAFVHYWVDVLNYAVATGDIDELSRISSPDCEGCQEYISAIREMYDRGGYHVGGEWSVENVEVATTPDSRLVTIDVRWGDSTFRTAADEAEQRGEADQDSLLLEVRSNEVLQLVRKANA